MNNENPQDEKGCLLETASLGFGLKVRYHYEEMPDGRRGEHKVWQVLGCQVAADAVHYITIHRGLTASEKIEVVAHECYHLFYSIRHLIACDEETEACVFGQLVEEIYGAEKELSK